MRVRWCRKKAMKRDLTFFERGTHIQSLKWHKIMLILKPQTWKQTNLAYNSFPWLCKPGQGILCLWVSVFQFWNKQTMVDDTYLINLLQWLRWLCKKLYTWSFKKLQVYGMMREEEVIHFNGALVQTFWVLNMCYCPWYQKALLKTWFCWYYSRLTHCLYLTLAAKPSGFLLAPLSVFLPRF